MVGPTIKNIDDYGSLLILSEMLTFIYLKSIREQGGAYGAGCALDESGIISFYSYRDPQVDKTYLNFEKGIQEIIEGKFSTQQLDESKLLAFQKLDKVLDPSLKGLISFTRGFEDAEKM